MPRTSSSTYFQNSSRASRGLEFRRAGNEVKVHLLGQIGLPVAAPASIAADAEEQTRHYRCDSPCRHATAAGRSHRQSARRGTGRDALQAPGAFGGLDRDQLGNRQCRWASFGALVSSRCTKRCRGECGAGSPELRVPSAHRTGTDSGATNSRGKSTPLPAARPPAAPRKRKKLSILTSSRTP